MPTLQPCSTRRPTAHLRALTLGLWLGAALLSTSANAAGEPLVIKFSHVVASETPKGKGADYFKKLVEERSKGSIKVEVYPNSTLYKDKEEVEALQLGAVQMLAPSLSKFGPIGAKEFEAFDLPFLFPNETVLRRVTQGAVGEKLLDKLERFGIKGLAYWDNGYKVMSANKPLQMPEDMKGLKMRIQSSKVLESQMRTLGALPQVLSFAETYQALQTGVVDGTENTPSNYSTQKHFEVQKYITLTNHGYIGYAVIAGKKFWDALDASQRTLLTQAMKETTDYVNTIAKKENDDAIAMMKASGKTTILSLSDEQRRAWINAVQPVIRDTSDRVGADLIKAIQAEAAK